MPIQNPPAWIWDFFNRAVTSVGSARPEEYWGNDAETNRETETGNATAPLAVRRVSLRDLRDALAQGYADFAVRRTDVVFLCLIYPVLGLVLARVASGYDAVPLLFPLASGFALIGPFAAVGLNEMSRRRELGEDVGWADAFAVLRSPSIGAIAMLGVILMVIFLAWLATANAIYLVTLGPEAPASFLGFVSDTLTTSAGWTMMVAGIGVGFLFAVLTLSISVISFPFLLDHNASLGAAIMASVRAVTTNPATMAAWGLIVACALMLGSIPFFLGLIVVMPVLGHATWHLYRKIMPASR